MTNLEELKRLLAKATPGPWKVWDSCSFWRISHERDGDVISAYNQSDGHPDLLAERADLDLLCALRNAAPALIEELEALREYYDAAQLFPIGEVAATKMATARSRVEAIRGRRQK